MLCSTSDNRKPVNSVQQLVLSAFQFSGLLLLTCGSLQADEHDVSFEVETGWTWIVPPQGWESKGRSAQMAHDNGAVLMFEEGRDGDLVVVVAHPEYSKNPKTRFYDWNVVAYAKHGTKHQLIPRVSNGAPVPGTKQWVILERWRCKATLPAKDVTHVGFLGLNHEGFRANADKARTEAEQLGLQPLPFPEFGEQYKFRVAGLDGRFVGTPDYDGKVVVLDFWATWCYPCMKKMPKLRRLYEEYHEDGLEIVGINFDDTEDDCKKAIEKFDIPWKQIMALSDDKQRTLWMKSMGLGSLPRILIIGRDGNLSADCEADELEKNLTLILNKK